MIHIALNNVNNTFAFINDNIIVTKGRVTGVRMELKKFCSEKCYFIYLFVFGRARVDHHTKNRK